MNQEILEMPIVKFEKLIKDLKAKIPTLNTLVNNNSITYEDEIKQDIEQLLHISRYIAKMEDGWLYIDRFKESSIDGEDKFFKWMYDYLSNFSKRYKKYSLIRDMSTSDFIEFLSEYFNLYVLQKYSEIDTFKEYTLDSTKAIISSLETLTRKSIFEKDTISTFTSDLSDQFGISPEKSRILYSLIESNYSKFSKLIQLEHFKGISDRLSRIEENIELLLNNSSKNG